MDRPASGRHRGSRTAYAASLKAGDTQQAAARIGGAASAAEILVSASTLAAARRPLSESGRRTLELKGISAPVEVVSVDWR